MTKLNMLGQDSGMTYSLFFLLSDYRIDCLTLIPREECEAMISAGAVIWSDIMRYPAAV